MKRISRALCSKLYRRLRVSGPLLLAALLTSSCIFQTTFEIGLSETEAGTTIFFSSFPTMSKCTTLEELGDYSCTYQWGEGEEDYAISTVGIDGIALAVLTILLDPLVLQLPAEASNFVGTYGHTNSNERSDLVITSGLSTLRADANSNYQAEAGMQLVVLELPADEETEGLYNFRFNFQVPNSFDEVLHLPMLARGQ